MGFNQIYPLEKDILKIVVLGAHLINVMFSGLKIVKFPVAQLYVFHERNPMTPGRDVKMQGCENAGMMATKVFLFCRISSKDLACAISFSLLRIIGT